MPRPKKDVNAAFALVAKDLLENNQSVADWYDIIEEPVRDLVKLLRSNGFNTFCSCGHKKYVQMEWYGFEEETRRLYGLLWDSGYKKFELHICWPSSGIGKFLEIKLLNEN